MKIELDWNTFSQRYLLEHRIFTLELDDKWIFYTNSEEFIIRCEVEKNEDHTENMMFVERQLSGRNIIKVESIEGEGEDIEIFEEVITEEQSGD